MKPYTTTIPGTDVSFDMVPIPGGKFKMGSPENEKGRKRGRRPACTKWRSRRSGWARSR